MLSLLFAAILLVVGLVGIALRKTYYYLPPKELKRQAEQGDKLSRTLYRAVSYGPSLRVLLWLIVGLASAGGVVLLSRSAPWWIGFIATGLLLWLAFSWLPNTRVTAVGARLAALLTPIITGLLGYLHPVFSRIGEPFHRHYQTVDHTGLYETDDLIELLQKQKVQDDNRIPAARLEAFTKVLTAHHYKVGDVLTPRTQVKAVSDNDTVGLVLLDELHASKQSSFPVVQGKTDKVVGALYIQDLNLKTEGKVGDYMHRSVRYLHEEDSLAQALQAFFKTKQQLFVVVNSFEEYVGILTLEHVVKQLTGEMRADDFDQHEDLTAVASKHLHDDEPEAEELKAEPDEVSVPEPDDDIVEPEPEKELVAEAPVKEEPEAETDNEAPEKEETEPELESTQEPELEKDDEPDEELSMADEPDGENESQDLVDPDNLAALDLPEEQEDDIVGSHITFEKPKAKKPRAKQSDDEVVE